MRTERRSSAGEESSVTPRRIQRRRTKGWRMPAGAVSVTRPGLFGNPFDWMALGRARAVEFYRRWLADDFTDEEREAARIWVNPGWFAIRRAIVLASLSELRGKDLVCWCRSTSPVTPTCCWSWPTIAESNRRSVAQSLPRLVVRKDRPGGRVGQDVGLADVNRLGQPAVFSRGTTARAAGQQRRRQAGGQRHAQPHWPSP